MSQVQTVGSGADKAKVGLAAVLLVAALVLFSVLEKHGAVVQWGVLLAGVVLALVSFFLSQTGRDLVAFGHATKDEVRKVVWPARKEATQITLYVFVFVVVMALFLWLTDKTVEWVFYDLILGWKK